MVRLHPRILHSLAGITFLLLTPSAGGAEDLYAGIAGAQSDFETDISVRKGATLDSKSSAGYLFIGREFDNGKSAEGFYANLGKTRIIGKADATLSTAGSTYRFRKNATATASVKTFGVAGKYHFDLHARTRLSAKFGVHSWKRRTSLTGTAANIDVKDDGVDAMAGLGIEFAATDKLALMFGHDNFAIDNDSVAVSYLGLKLKFD